VKANPPSIVQTRLRMYQLGNGVHPNIVGILE
jgi:hypothetical protein